MAGMMLFEVAGLHVEVEGALGAAGLDAGHPLHFRRRLQVLEIMRLVDEDMVHTQLVKNQSIILLVLGGQVFELGLACRFLFFDGLDEIAVGSCCPLAGTVEEQLVIFLDLLVQEFLLVLTRHADALEAAMGDNDGVPVAAGDLGGQVFAAFLCKILLARDQQLGVGIPGLELAGELLQ